jgi:hypothetical protein
MITTATAAFIFKFRRGNYPFNFSGFGASLKVPTGSTQKKYRSDNCA